MLRLPTSGEASKPYEEYDIFSSKMLSFNLQQSDMCFHLQNKAYGRHEGVSAECWSGTAQH